MKAKVFTLASFSPRPGLYFISLAANSPYLAFSLFYKLLSPLRYPHFLHLPFPPFQGFPQGVFLRPVSSFVLPPALKFLTEAGAPEKAFLTFSHEDDALRTSWDSNAGRQGQWTEWRA